MPPPSTDRSRPTGPSAAALLGAGLGLAALGIVQVLSEASTAWKDAMQRLGSLWIPGAEGIGPYSGKETVTLVVWLVSWALLARLWRRRDVDLVVTGFLMLVCLGLATTLLWPPVTHLLVH